METEGGDCYLCLDHHPEVSSVEVVREHDSDHVRIVIESSTPRADMSMSVPLDAGQAHELGDQLQAHATLMDSEQAEETGGTNEHHRESEEQSE